MDYQMIEAMVDWVEDHLDEGFSLERLSLAMGYSSYYCSFKFRQVTGISTKRYRLLRLLYEASVLLIQTEQSILSIACQSGYASQVAFSRAFKELFGVSPKAFRLNLQPLQTYVKISIIKGEQLMDISKKLKIDHLQQKFNPYDDRQVLMILNGQVMYQAFSSHQLMGGCDYLPFNEAMCVHTASYPLFDAHFNQLRAAGHGVSLESYTTTVLAPLEVLKTKSYQCVVLWFGEDMFCQMNLLTCLAYLEQQDFQGKVYYHAVNEVSYEVQETEVTLGSYRAIYETVLVKQQEYQGIELPVLHQGVALYLDLLNPQNPITTYIAQHLTDNRQTLLENLFQLFPQYGLGDT